MVPKLIGFEVVSPTIIYPSEVISDSDEFEIDKLKFLLLYNMSKQSIEIISLFYFLFLMV